MGKTTIGWTERTWNPLTGCTRVSAGCDHCYAFALHDMRYKAHLAGEPMPVQYHKPFTAVQLFPQRLEEPLHIKKPTKFFVNSMSDLFHSDVPDEYIKQVFDVMNRAHWHTFQVLTKRVGRLRYFGPELHWSPNIHMGVSIESDEFSPRANAVRMVPAAVRFLSLEPLIGPLPSLDLSGIDWVITGGESGKDARPMSLEWVRAIRDQCAEQHVAFFHKQMGACWARENARYTDRHGEDMDYWPPDLRIRQFPVPCTLSI